MVREEVIIRGKKKGFIGRYWWVFLIGFLIVGILLGVYYLGYFNNSGNQVVLENPLKNIVFSNTNSEGKVNKTKVLAEGVLKFNADYINFILLSMGVGNLHSGIGYGDPILEFNLDGDIWGSKLENGLLKTTKSGIDDPDLVISMSKVEAVEALLSSDIADFMKDSVRDGNTGIELKAGKLELFSKGYLAMYSELTGEKVEVE